MRASQSAARRLAARLKRAEKELVEPQPQPEPQQISERQAALARCAMRAQQRKG